MVSLKESSKEVVVVDEDEVGLVGVHDAEVSERYGGGRLLCKVRGANMMELWSC